MIEAMRQALEALEMYLTLDTPEEAHLLETDIAPRAYAALRQAIEQAVKQEPIGYEHHEFRPLGAPGEIRIHGIFASQYRLPDGTISGDFQWLADQYKRNKDTIKLMPLYYHPPVKEESVLDLLVRSRNLLSQPPHWVDTPENAEIREALSVEITKHLNGYTAPPKPEWVGLTDEEINNILGVLMCHYTCEPNAKDFAKAISAKLKEKNHG
jgi:hypothetical protein